MPNYLLIRHSPTDNIPLASRMIFAEDETMARRIAANNNNSLIWMDKKLVSCDQVTKKEDTE